MAFKCTAAAHKLTVCIALREQSAALDCGLVETLSYCVIAEPAEHIVCPLRNELNGLNCYCVGGFSIRTTEQNSRSAAKWTTGRLIHSFFFSVLSFVYGEYDTGEGRGCDIAPDDGVQPRLRSHTTVWPLTRRLTKRMLGIKEK